MNTDLALFFGRFHPVLVHLPIGLLVLLGFLELLARWPRFQTANSNAGLIIALAAPLSALTAALGWLLSQGGGYDARLLQLHMWTGIGTAAVATLAGLLYAAKARGAYRVVLWCGVGLLAVSSHFGGSLTHGRDYLTRYAPETLRNLFKGTKPVVPPPVKGEPGAEPSEPPLFTSKIAPILDDKCSACHGAEKSKAGLRVDSFEALMKGGDSGPGVVAGNSAQSEVIKRMSLPIDHDDHMPPDGKPQPTPDEIALLRWWIDSGASPTNPADAGKAPPNVARLLKVNAAPVADAPKKTEQPPPMPRTEAEPRLQAILQDLALPASFLGQTEAWVQVNASVHGKAFTRAELAKVSDAVGANVRWLDLSGTAVADEDLAMLTNYPNLQRLHLQRTAVTDEGLTHVAALSSLEYLNLYGTKISKAGLEKLKAMPKLRQLYLWQTQVSPAEAKAFADEKMDKAQIAEWERQIGELKQRIRGQQVRVDVGTPVATNEVKVADAGKAASTNSINAICPVSGKPIDAAQTVLHEGKLVAFCCQHCKAKFEENPKEFADKIVKKSE